MSDNPSEEKTVANGQSQSKKYRKKVKRISIIAVIVFLVLTAAVSVPLFKALSSEKGIEALKNKLKSYSGVTGVIIFTFIQALQVVIAIVPPIQIVGGVLFGWFFGALLSYLGIVLGTFVVFVIVSRLGKPLVDAFVDDKLMTRFKFLQDDKKLIRILMLLYIIPAVPKDPLTYIVPLTKVKRRDFFMYVMPCRIPAVVVSTVLGSNVKDGNFKTAVALLGVSVLIAVAGYVLKDPIVNEINKRRNRQK